MDMILKKAGSVLLTISSSRREKPSAGGEVPIALRSTQQHSDIWSLDTGTTSRDPRANGPMGTPDVA